MIEQFDEDYVAYRRRVPMFLPRRGERRRLLDSPPGGRLGALGVVVNPHGPRGQGRVSAGREE